MRTKIKQAVNSIAQLLVFIFHPVKDDSLRGMRKHAWENLRWSGKVIYSLSFVFIGFPISILGLLVYSFAWFFKWLYEPRNFSSLCVGLAIVFYINIDSRRSHSLAIGLIGITFCGVAMRLRWSMHDNNQD